MKWFKIIKSYYSKASTRSNYKQWKEDLAEESKQQCVYCCIHTSSFGGIRNFHVEHYKPKGNEKFAHLIHEYSNLFFSCSICNTFKGEAWPNEPTSNYDNMSFPDPSKVNYSDFLSVDKKFNVTSSFVTGEYLIKKLFLNRPQMILERKDYYFKSTLYNEVDEIEDLLKLFEKNNPDPKNNMFIKTVRIFKEHIANEYAVKYKDTQTKR